MHWDVFALYWRIALSVCEVDQRIKGPECQDNVHVPIRVAFMWILSLKEVTPRDLDEMILVSKPTQQR